MASINTLPEKYAFSPVLTDEQILLICSTTSGTAFTTRCSIAALKMDSAQMMRLWETDESASSFYDLLQNIPAAIDANKELTRLMECSYARLMLTGDVALNGLDESDDDEEPTSLNGGATAIELSIDAETAAKLDKFAEQWGCSRDEAATRLIQESLQAS